MLPLFVQVLYHFCHYYIDFVQAHCIDFVIIIPFLSILYRFCHHYIIFVILQKIVYICYMNQHYTKITSDNWDKVEFGDKLVFFAIKDAANKDGYSTTSIDRISKLSKVNKTHVQEAIKRLEAAGFLEVISGASRRMANTYKFNPTTSNYENFSREFLELDLKPYLKEYYMRLLPYCFSSDKDQVKQGCKEVSTYLTDEEIAKKLKICTRTVKRYNNLLKTAGMLTEASTTESNSIVTAKTFNQENLANVIQAFIKETKENVDKATIKSDKALQIAEQTKAETERMLNFLENEFPGLKDKYESYINNTYNF